MMKTTPLFAMKSGLLLLLTAVLLGACSKKEDKGPDEKADPKLLSFGFYAEDNTGVITRDYVLESVTGTAISLALPKEVDKSVLVARFTTSDNVTVTVSGAIQQSGTTDQDFSVPVDYIVTQGQANAKYTVTVTNAASYVWSRLSSYTTDNTNNLIMKVNPASGLPYILYQGNREESDDEKAMVVKFENNTWSFVGAASGISDGEVGSYLDLSFNSAGEPYAAYLDYTATPSQSATVKHFDGNSWTLVGNKGLTQGKVSYTAIGINPVGQYPMVFNTNDERNGSVPRRAQLVSVFNGSSWSINNQIPGRAATTFGSLPVTKTVGNTLYLGIFNNGGTPQTYSVYKYANNTWETVAEKAIENGATNLNLRDFDMDVDAEGNIYVVAADDATTNDVYNPRVKKYDAATKTWSQVGSVIPVDLGATRYFSLALSPTGIPYLLYRNDQNFPAVISLDTDTKDWTAPEVLDAAELGVSDLYLDFAPNGVGYAAYVNSSDQVVLQKLDAPQQ